MNRHKGLSKLLVVLHVVLVTNPFYCYSCFALLLLSWSSLPAFLICYSAALRHMGFFRLVFAFSSVRSFHAVRTAPVITSSLAAASELCVCPLFPHRPATGSKRSGASSLTPAR